MNRGSVRKGTTLLTIAFRDERRRGNSIPRFCLSSAVRFYESNEGLWADGREQHRAVGANLMGGRHMGYSAPLPERETVGSELPERSNMRWIPIETKKPDGKRPGLAAATCG